MTTHRSTLDRTQPPKPTAKTERATPDGCAASSGAPGSAPYFRRTLQEIWIRRYTGYFGEPSRLSDYRQGNVTFGELYRSAMKMAEDMVTEAGSITEDAFSDGDR